MRLKHLFLLAPFLVGFALAQDTTTSTAPDVAAWFASTAALAAVIAAAVAFIRKHIIKTLDGLGVILASIVVGAALGLVGQLLGYVEGGTVSGLLFGASAGLVASGGVDALKGILGGSKSRAG